MVLEPFPERHGLSRSSKEARVEVAVVHARHDDMVSCIDDRCGCGGRVARYVVGSADRCDHAIDHQDRPWVPTDPTSFKRQHDASLDQECCSGGHAALLGGGFLGPISSPMMVHRRFELGILRRLDGSKWPVFRSERAVTCGSLVSEGGLEPPHPCGHQPLKLARLPIPPLRRGIRMPRTAVNLPAPPVPAASLGTGAALWKKP